MSHKAAKPVIKRLGGGALANSSRKAIVQKAMAKSATKKVGAVRVGDTATGAGHVTFAVSKPKSDAKKAA